MVAILLAERYLSYRNHYAAMDAAALERYPILRRVGIFGVESSTTRGALQFVKMGLEVLKAKGVLWITPQGRFADVRERPIIFKPGLAGLGRRVPGGCVAIPLAIEYVFWNERLPEVLLHFGEPVHISDASAQISENFDRRMNESLRQAMDELAAKSVARDSSNFETILTGRVGVGGFYEIGQRFWARLAGRTYTAAHTTGEKLDGQR